MKKMVNVIWLPLVLSGCVTISLFPRIEPVQETVLEGSGDSKILLLDISGVISEESDGGMAEELSIVARVKEELIKAANDSDIKAVVLRINSPGGTVTASDTLYHEIIRFRERTGIKVIAFIGGIGASGAYYAAMAADQVIAAPTAVTGSIGVIMLHMDVHGLLGKIGVDAQAIKSGANKDMGSPFRELSENDRALFQEMINTMQARFMEVVSKNRKGMDDTQRKEISSGRIFTAEQAKKMNLIDQIGHLDHAIDLAKQEAGIKEAKIVLYRRPYQYANNVYSQLFQNNPLSIGGLNPQTLLAGRSSQFFYLWLP